MSGPVPERAGAGPTAGVTGGLGGDETLAAAKDELDDTLAASADLDDTLAAAADVDATLAAVEAASGTSSAGSAPPPGERYLPLASGGKGPANPGDRPMVIGAGGVGRVLGVYDAHLQRPVALKELLARGPGRGTRRFLREARVTAQLQHPSIVPVYELAESDERPFYTMKLVEGRTLAEVIDDCQTLEQRLGLLGHFVNACQAIAYAHQRGVVHRDIKPANIMVGEFGETIVLDWGLAKLAGDEPPADGELVEPQRASLQAASNTVPKTIEGSVMGTPAYMSPEQARGEVDRVDARTDTWALGLVLFELLAGERAIDGPTTIAVLAKAQAGEVRSLAKLCPDVAPELRAIVERALRVEPDDRYPDAGALAADVEAFRNGALVGAHDYTAAEHLRRFLARHRQAVAVGLVAALALTVLGLVALERIVAERDRAQAAELVAQQQREVAEAGRSEAQQQRELAESARTQAVARLADALVVQAETALADDNASAAWLQAAEALALVERPDARGIVLGASQRPTPRFVDERTLPAACDKLGVDSRGAVLVCQSGDRLLTISADGQVSTRSLAELRDGTALELRSLAVAPGGQLIALSTSSGQLVLYDMQTSSWRALVGDEPSRSSPSDGLYFSVDGARLYSLIGRWDIGERLSMWDIASGERLASYPGLRNAGVALSADGKWLLGGGPDSLELLDARTLEHLRDIDIPGGSLHSPQFSPDGTRLIVASHDGRSWLIDTATWTLRREIAGSGGPGLLRWSDDGAYLLESREDGSMRVRGGDDGELVFVLPERRSDAGLHGFEPGTHVAWVQTSPTSLRRWEIEPDRDPRGLLGHGNVGPGVGFDPRGELFATTANDAVRAGRVWGQAVGAMPRELAQPSWSPIVSDDAAHVFMVVGEQAVRFDAADWSRHDLFAIDNKAMIALHGRQQLAFVSGGKLRIHDARDGALVRELPSAGSYPWPRPLANGDVVALRDGDRELVRIDTQTGEFHPLLSFEEPALTMLVSGNGRFVIVGFVSGQALVFDVERGQLVRRWQAHDHWAVRLAVSNDGRWAATADKSSRIRLWSLHDGQLRAELGTHVQRVIRMWFTSDDARLLSADSGGVIFAWDLERAERPATEILAEAKQRFGAPSSTR